MTDPIQKETQLKETDSDVEEAKLAIERSKLKLEWMKVIVTGIGSVLVPLAIAFFTITFQNTRNEEIELRYVDLAISILKEPPSDGTRELRQWAVETISYTSPIPFSNRAIDHIQQLPGDPDNDER